MTFAPSSTGDARPLHDACNDLEDRGARGAPHAEELGGAALAGVHAALARADGLGAARGLLAAAARSSEEDPDALDPELMARALDLPMPIDERIALLSMRGDAHRLRLDPSASEQDYADACALARTAGFRRAEARLLGELGAAARARRYLDAAIAHGRAALEIQEQLADTAEQSDTLTQLALVYLERGAPAEAHAAATRALTMTSDPARIRTAASVLATTFALLPRAEGSQAEVVLSQPRGPDASTRTNLAEGASARPARPSPESFVLAETRGARSAERAEETGGYRGARPPDRDGSSSEAARVAIDGAWLERDGSRVACDRRAATRRLLATLVRARTESPGEVVSTDALISAGWPDEVVTRAAGRNRLRVALSWLRKHGLGPALASRGDGYLLEPGAVDVASADRDDRHLS